MKLTGRITALPDDVLREEILDPQFTAEARTLLPGYVAIEKVLILEYLRMGLIDPASAAALGARLGEVDQDRIVADSAGNLSDIAFAIERYVQDGPVTPPGTWHVDRSRNDLQACAQLMYARSRVVDLVGALTMLARRAAGVAAGWTRTPMPGYTHLQAAQIVTPGFYLAAFVEETLGAARQLRATHDAVNQCPLGAGAMAGQELDWDLDRMSTLLAFDRPAPHALVAVASRGWALRIAGDLSAYGVVLGRFATDLMAWASGAYGFVDLPDELAGISSAMPQKRNFPVLERIRGRSAHLSALHLDLVLGQRGTPYANMVEVSKEAGTHLPTLLTTAASVLRLATTVVGNLRFLPDRMRMLCERDHLGGFRLANLLALRAGVPWRSAQVIAGGYIAEAVSAGRSPAERDVALLRRLAEGHDLVDPGDMLSEAFDVDSGLAAKVSPGSTHPVQVERLLAEQRSALDELLAWSHARQSNVRTAMSELDRLLRGACDAV
ncbi:argininosuccinate lyase [Micromonospora echinofusca]|uniref:argininosuccinate lyase n=1 Tax=Micromonospora echinofusca TaxID=47858 RepID=A0ABS3VIS5_MICEH|nr:lyase family protein [Micromonospora echinofusca]MBO4204421.1 argininosuccinate lyase [Micromonospora echinofusca]